MTKYGYKVAAFRIAQNGKPADYFSMDNPSFGQEGFIELLGTVIDQLVATKGRADESRGDYLRIDTQNKSNWGLVLKVSGGAYGEDLEIVDVVNHEPRGRITSSHALLREGHVILIVPPYGYEGLMITEAISGHHHGVPLQRVLDRKLRDDQKLSIQITHEIADTVAWSSVLEEGKASVAEVTFVDNKPSSDGTPFTNRAGVKSTRLTYTFDKGSKTQKEISKALIRAAREKRNVGLLGILGASGLDEDKFDEQQAVIVEDGERRKITVTKEFPRFIYNLDTDVKLSPADFANEVKGAAESTLRAYNIDLPRQWWPEVT